MNAFLKSTTILLAALPWQASRLVEAADRHSSPQKSARGLASVPPASQAAGNSAAVSNQPQPQHDAGAATRATNRQRFSKGPAIQSSLSNPQTLQPAILPAHRGIGTKKSAIELQERRKIQAGTKLPIVKVQEQPSTRQQQSKPGETGKTPQIRLPNSSKPRDIVVGKPRWPQGDKPRDIDSPAVRLPQVDRKPGAKLPGKIKLPETANLPGTSNLPKPQAEPDRRSPHAGLKSPIRLIDNHRLKDARPIAPLADRMKRGDLHKIIDSKSGHQLELKKQFELHSQGDLGRRLNLQNQLQKRGGWQNRVCGPIDPLFSRNCFNSWYCGPSWYPAACWFPQWCGWVNWCWNFNCLPICDPRPIYCRPICYDPCVAWIGWSYPVWTTLPAVTCGTWVDAPVVTVDAGYDMQLLAVRFVDPGHPEQNLGPRYRVWLRNNSPADVVQPFNVLAYASTEREPGMGLPEAGVRITKMDAGQIITVDLRLPAEANVLARDIEGRKVPFEFLHVVVDSHREIAEAFEANNGAVLDRRDILQIDPALFAIESEERSTGAVINLAGEGFGPEAGQVLVVVGSQELQAEVVGWCDLGVRVRMPAIALSSDAAAEVLVVRGDLAASNPVPVRLEATSVAAVLP